MGVLFIGVIAMPRVHRCGQHNCHVIIPLDQRYCEEHRPEHESINDQSYAQRRKHDSYRQEQIKFYHSKAWHHIRLAVMSRDHGVCRYCYNHGVVTSAATVDHIVPREVALDMALCESNLVACCGSCHRKKTIWEQKHYGTGKGNKLKNDVIVIRRLKQFTSII